MDIPVNAAGLITESALTIAGDGALDIQNVLQDIQGGEVADESTSDEWGNVTVTKEGHDFGASNTLDKAGAAVLEKYGYAVDWSATDTSQYGKTATGPNITQASGAMIIDDLMQKISTKVQVASQMLATVNNINKTASRVISQG